MLELKVTMLEAIVMSYLLGFVIAAYVARNMVEDSKTTFAQCFWFPAFLLAASPLVVALLAIGIAAMVFEGLYQLSKDDR